MSIEAAIQYRAASVSDLTGKVAVVTGGTRGIGRAISIALGAAGAVVVICGRDPVSADLVIKDITSSGGVAHFLQADLSDDEAVDALIARVVDQFGQLDILVNNAGIDADAPALTYDLADWRRVLRLNLEVPFRLSQAAAEHYMLRGSGVIVNIASVLGFVGVNEACSYVAAKHGLIGLTRELAIEWSRKGIRVNAVAPGLIQTDMTSYVWRHEGAADYIAQRIPAGRIGQPSDIGGAVVFLSSDAAAFIHGETIVIDGGFLAT